MVTEQWLVKTSKDAGNAVNLTIHLKNAIMTLNCLYCKENHAQQI